MIRHGTSFNFGHLSDVNESEITKALLSADWIAERQAKRLFGVGGSFRAFGTAFLIGHLTLCPCCTALK